LDAIGLHGRLSGAASRTESRGRVIGVGGWPGRSQWRRFQSGYGGFQTRPGQVCARGCWAELALRRHHRVVLVRVKGGVGRGCGAQEHGACSGRAGRPDRLTSTWMGQHARSRSRGSASGNRSVGSWQVWRRGDGSGGGRWHSASTWRPRWAMATSRGDVGRLGLSLQGGVNLGGQQDWGSAAAWVVEAEEREKGFGRVASGFPSSLDAK
jgi:hypothetical protein